MITQNEIKEKARECYAKKCKCEFLKPLIKSFTYFESVFSTGIEEEKWKK